MITHEDYIRTLAAFVVEHADLNPTERDQLATIKLVYGSGPSGTRGVTFYGKWKSNGVETAVPFVEVSAFGQSSWIQIAGTTIHELGHVLAGWGAGHDKGWHDACERLGLLKMLAGGTDYKEENFAPWVWAFIETLEKPDEGEPVRSLGGGDPNVNGGWNGGIFAGFMRGKAIKGCQAGIGTRGGKSRGVGSGSRLRLFQCECQKPVKVRIAADDFDAMHNVCKANFKRA